jgi:alpha-galactosidase
VAILNNGSTAASYSIPVAHIGWTKDIGCSLEITESFSGNKTTLNACENGASLQANLASHETAVWRISNGGKGGWTSTGAIFNSANLDCLSLSSDSKSVSWKTCDASDEQVWTVGKKGSYIKNTASGQCLSAGSNASLTVTSCEIGSTSTTFSYDTSGNIKHPASGYMCLTEADDGSASLASCLNLANSQVFELPSGKCSATDEHTQCEYTADIFVF